MNGRFARDETDTCNGTSKTRPCRPISCDLWIVEQMRYPTNSPTDRPTNGHSQLKRCFVAPKNMKVSKKESEYERN